MLSPRIWRHARLLPQHESAVLVATAAAASTSMMTTVPLLQGRAYHRFAVRPATTPPLTSLSIRPRIVSSPRLPLFARGVYSAADEPGVSPEDEAEEGTANDQEALYLDILDRAYRGEKNWHVAKDVYDEIISRDGQGLTVSVATSLIEVFAARHKYLECLQTLKYAREHQVRPRIHAYSNTIACCYKENKYAQALRVFEIMRNDGYVPMSITYSRALSAALKSAHHELVLEIFDDMLRNRVEPNIVTYNNILNSCARVGDVHSARGVLRAIRQRGLEMTQSSYHSLAICAGKTGTWELAEEAFTALKSKGFAPAMTMYNSVIAAYAKGKQWPAIIRIYDEMPAEMKDMLYNAYFGGVIMAYAKSEDPEERRKALEIFEARKARGGDGINLFAHNAVLIYYQSVGDYHKLLALAKEMKQLGFKYDQMTYNCIILAHIRKGEYQTAENLLQKHAKHMERSTECFRELIRHYAEDKQDYLAACKLSMTMMQKNPRLSRRDWHTALEYSLKLEEKSLYWNFRKWMRVRAPMIIDDVPSELMLPVTHKKRS